MTFNELVNMLKTDLLEDEETLLSDSFVEKLAYSCSTVDDDEVNVVVDDELYHAALERGFIAKDTLDRKISGNGFSEDVILGRWLSYFSENYWIGNSGKMLRE